MVQRSRNRNRRPFLTRFFSNFEQGEGCWEWTGMTRNGYGSLSYRDRPFYAHRIAYEMYKGPIPEGLQIDHLCRNRPCVNPDHLEAVTHGENLRRAMVHRSYPTSLKTLRVACNVPGCDRLALYKRGPWCNRHYSRWRKHGDPSAGRRLACKGSWGTYKGETLSEES